MSRTKEKFVRRPDYASGDLTEAEKVAMAEHVKLWTRRAFRTEPISPEKIGAAIGDLYRAANLKVRRVVVVPSPFVMAFAGGFAAAIWHLRKSGEFATGAATLDATWAATAAATHAATLDATWAATAAVTRAATWAATGAATGAATSAATRAATWAATWDAMADATHAATRAATWDATAAATLDATWDATAAVTRAATWAATADATAAATLDATWDAAGKRQNTITEFLLSCARNWSNMYQGGNMWAGYEAYLTAARDILGLRLKEHEKYAAWERCAIEGGFRIMHDEFCMVCDFPERILIDAQNRPHCDNGPSHRWRDGWSLYHVHGVRVPAQVVEAPHTLTVAQIDEERNAEVRRVMIERYGQQRYLLDSGATVFNRDRFGALYRKEIDGDEPLVMVKLRNSTPEPDGSVRDYFLRVPPNVTTAQEAVAWTFGLERKQYAPTIET